MKAKLLFAGLYLILLVSISVGQVRGSDEYNKGIEALQNNNISIAEDYFKESISKNREASSFYQLGKLQLGKNTFESRQLALENLKQAALRDPANFEYGMAYAEILEKLARRSAKTEYEALIKSFPDKAGPLIGYGRLFVEDYYEWKNSRKFTGLEDAKDDWDLAPFAEDDYKKAEEYLKRALEMEPENVNACFEISRLYINSSVLPNSIPYLKRMCNVNPSDKEPHLYLGMVYNRMGELNEADKEFQQAIDLMHNEEREDFIYGSVVKLLSPKYDVEKKYKTKEEIENFISRFWKVSNPLKLSGNNQRLLEHYSRLAYANLHFSLPKQNIAGWKTERGEVVIRYGIPVLRTKTRQVGIYPKNEIFEYDGFRLTFDDYRMNGNYKLSYSPYGGGTKRISNPRSNEQSFPMFERLKSRQIQSYRPRGIQLNLLSKLFRFRNLEGKGTKDIESYMVYTLPTQNLSGYDDIKNSPHSYGIYLFDDDFTPLLEKTGNVNIDRVKKINKDERNLLKLDNIEFISPAKQFSFSFEVMKFSDSSYYSYQTVLPAPEPEKEGLNLSQMVFVSAVEENEEIAGAIKRGRLNILPNILSAFRTNESTYLYYEIYGLTKGKDGLTDFEQKITIKEHTKLLNDGTLIGGIIDAVGNILSKNPKVSLTSSYRTKEENPQQYVQIDLSKYTPGRYDIILTVQDRISGKVTEKSSIIGIWGINKIELLGKYL